MSRGAPMIHRRRREGSAGSRGLAWVRFGSPRGSRLIVLLAERILVCGSMNDASTASAHGHTKSRGDLLPLALGALGVVYGDIGTSPLYAMREAFHGPFALATSSENILGVLSLMV